MDEELKRKLLADLQVSGFAAELQALNQLVERKWLAFTGFHYIDRDEDKEREIDINAVFELEENMGERDAIFRLRLMADVKKSKSPWVVLRARTTFDLVDFEVGQATIADGLNLAKDFSLLPFELARHTIAMEQGWIGRGVHEAFKSPHDHSRSYVAFGSVCKACEATMTGFRSGEITANEAQVVCIQPAIILDGPLWSAYVGENGETELKAEKWASVSFRQRSKMLTRDQYIIDVVCRDNLGEYLSLLETRAKETVRIFKTAGYI